MNMRVDILTLFPDSVRAALDVSILGRAMKKGVLEIRCTQIRDYTDNRQQQVDDYPYGGGWGCVMMAQPLKACLDSVMSTSSGRRSRVIYLSPQGRPFCQEEAKRLVREYDHLVLVCGHYEGVDERFIQECVDEELSLGDFVLTGGEIAAMAVTDAVCRLVPGVLSDEECYTGESHWEGLLEYPQYTRPEVWQGRTVPEVLRSGVDRDIRRWRRRKMLERTMDKRPDLWEKFVPETPEDRELVEEIQKERHPVPPPPVLDCRPAREEDLPALLEMAGQARRYLGEQGLEQWQTEYPGREDFQEDIRRGEGWLFTADGLPAGYICISRRPEAAYAQLQGEWLSCAGPYVCIHRMMIGEGYRGGALGGEMLSLAEDLAAGWGCAGIRVDTHPGNQPMLKLLGKHGFETCGAIRLQGGLEDGQPRRALEKLVGKTWN